MKKTSPVVVLLAFVIVALPLLWGLLQSVHSALPLFTGRK